MKNIFLRFRFSFLFVFIGFAVMLFAVVSCHKTDPTYYYSYGIKPTATDPWLPATPYNYPNTNGASNDLVTLGRVLFYDKNLSADNSVACGSCHQQANGFADNKSFSTGFGGQQTLRNAHSLVNTNNSFFWDGKVGSGSSAGGNGSSQSGGYNGGGGGGGQVSSLISVPLQSHIELNITDENALCAKLSVLSYYPYLFNRAFQNTTISMPQIELAIAGFIGTITASNSQFDQAFPSNGSPATVTLNQQQLDGMNVFNGRGKCSDCHIPSNNFSGNANQFEDIGLDLVYKDLGRGLITNNAGDNGRFHVPSLKNIALSAPYMHDGRFTTLTQVVDFFSDSIHSSPNLSSAFTAYPSPNGNGGFNASTNGPAVPLGLTAYEKSSLVAFLQTLTDNSLVTDIRYSDPFKH